MSDTAKQLKELQDKAKEVALMLNGLSIIEAKTVLNEAVRFLEWSNVSLKKEDLFVENVKRL